MSWRPGSTSSRGGFSFGEGESQPRQVDPAAAARSRSGSSPTAAALIDFEREAPNHPSRRKLKARLVRQRFNLSLTRYDHFLLRAVRSSEGLRHDPLLCFQIMGERGRRGGHLREVGA